MTQPLIMSVVENLLRKGEKVYTAVAWNNRAYTLRIAKVWTCTHEGGWKEAVFEGVFELPTGIWMEGQRRAPYGDCDILDLTKEQDKSWTLI
jgi:hypothetical protein